MTKLQQAYRAGWFDAQSKYAAPAPTNAVVKDSTALGGTSSPKAVQPLTAGPASITENWRGAIQSTSIQGPRAKTAETPITRCTTCRKPKHYGPCAKLPKTRPGGVPHKNAAFNRGMKGEAPETGNDNAENPATSPNYHSATSADSALARSRDGRPADEQAMTGFADLFRHEGITNPASEWTHAYGALNKTADPMNFGTALHSMNEHRGPSINPYEERPTVLAPPVGFGDSGNQRIERAFDQIDGAVDSTCIEGSSQPADGPAALG